MWLEIYRMNTHARYPSTQHPSVGYPRGVNIHTAGCWFCNTNNIVLSFNLIKTQPYISIAYMVKIQSIPIMRSDLIILLAFLRYIQIQKVRFDYIWHQYPCSIQSFPWNLMLYLKSKTSNILPGFEGVCKFAKMVLVRCWVVSRYIWIKLTVRSFHNTTHCQ